MEYLNLSTVSNGTWSRIKSRYAGIIRKGENGAVWAESEWLDKFDLERSHALSEERATATRFHAGKFQQKALVAFKLSVYRVGCEVCHWREFDGELIQVHHLLPRAMGGSDDSDNLIQLCPNHHAMAHFLLRNGLPYGDRQALISQLCATSQEKSVKKKSCPSL